MKPGDVIAERFELEHLAGQGGMGSVFRARDRHTQGLVAVKSLHDPGGSHADRFLREAQVLAELRHPNIVGYVDHGRSESGELYMAMEWVEGETLSERIARTGLTLGESVTLVSRVASALALAHARGIVHRDIKPNNVLLPMESVDPKLLDFGIARLSMASRLTGNGLMLGTPGYMAPEQARGASQVNARADVFSLGCLLFKCVTGRAPFQGEDVRQVLAKVLFENAPRLRSIRPDVPATLDDLCARMVARDASARPADGAAAVGELALVARDVPGAIPATLSAPESLGHAEQRWVSVVLARPAPGTETQTVVDMAQSRGGPVDEGIGTMLASGQGAPRDLVEALRAFDEEVSVLADGAYLVTVVSEVDPVALAVRATRVAEAMRHARPMLRLAITTGRALHADHAAVGPALDRAAQLLGQIAARPKEAGALPIRLDEATAALLAGRAQLGKDALGMRFHGDRPLDLEGVRAAFGREPELAALDTAWARALEARRGVWIRIHGPRGQGTTHLLRAWLARKVAEQGARWIGGRAESIDRHRRFAMLRRLVRSEVPFSQLEATLAGQLAMESNQGPLVVWIDDADQADPASLDAVVKAVARMERPVLAIATGSPVLAEMTLFQPLLGSMALGPMPAEAARAGLSAVWKAEAADPVVQLGMDVARGNPWALQQLAQSPVEAIRAGELPEPLLARIAARMQDQLQPGARRVLRAVSIWGHGARRADVGLLVAGELADPAIDGALELLVSGGWLLRDAESGTWSEPRFTPADRGVTDAALAMLAESDALLGHRLVAQALETRADVDHLVIAEHWRRAGHPLRASEALRRGAWSADQADHLDEAARLARRGLELAGQGPATAGVGSLLAHVERWRGELASARGALAPVLGLKEVAPDVAVRIDSLAASLSLELGEEPLLQRAAAGLEANVAWEGAELFAGAVEALEAAVLFNRWDIARVIEARLVSALSGVAVDPYAEAAREHLEAFREAARGLPWRAAEAHLRAERIWQELGEGRRAVLERLAAGRRLIEAEDVAGAESAVVEARRSAEQGGWAGVTLAAAALAAQVALLKGESATAVERARGVAATASRRGARSTQVEALRTQVEAERRLGLSPLLAMGELGRLSPPVPMWQLGHGLLRAQVTLEAGRAASEVAVEVGPLISRVEGCPIALSGGDAIRALALHLAEQLGMVEPHRELAERSRQRWARQLQGVGQEDVKRFLSLRASRELAQAAKWQATRSPA